VSKRTSVEFERLVERIYQLVEEEGSEVTWNDHVVDPDNPDQSRQIDVTIERQGRRTHVECRIRKAPQDVTWIEGLIGRRLSLKADAIIAVSASGFTTGAVKKAEAYGIILRTLHTLTEQEIRDWGKPVEVEIVYYEFSDTRITFKTPNIGQRITDERGHAPIFRPLFETS
jgi:hypothetical protein